MKVFTFHVSHLKFYSTRLAALLLAAFSAVEVSAGSITGTVRAEGKAGTELDASNNKYDSRQFKFVERVNYSEMRDFVVYIEGPVGAKPAPPEKPLQVVTKRVLQKGAMFSPHVLPVMVGQKILIRNSDEFLHNVHSLATNNPPFNFGQPNKDEGKPVEPSTLRR